MLLSIVIPTYNRASYLNLNLKVLFSQIKEEYYEDLEVVISDNQSTDNTSEVVRHYVNNPFPNYIYHLNPVNIGLDGNITQSFSMANGDFVLILGDDDILVDGALDKIFKLIKEYKNSGVIYIEHYGFKENHIKEKPLITKAQFHIYDDLEAFIKRVNYYFTFVSGNIINKKLINSRFELSQFLGTNVNLLNWTFAALLHSERNIYVEDCLIAMKTENTGGYAFCETFGKNSNKIFEFYSKGKLKKRNFEYINKKLLRIFFPSLIIKFQNNTAFKKENHFHELSPLYKSNINFWVFCVPIILLPKFLGTAYFIFNRMYNKLEVFYNLKIKEFFLKGAGKIKTIQF